MWGARARGVCLRLLTGASSHDRDPVIGPDGVLPAPRQDETGPGPASGVLGTVDPGYLEAPDRRA